MSCPCCLHLNSQPTESRSIIKPVFYTKFTVVGHAAIDDGNNSQHREKGGEGLQADSVVATMNSGASFMTQGAVTLHSPGPSGLEAP